MMQTKLTKGNFMKKQIMSLVVLIAAIASFNTASANSDVPDNMMAKQGEDFRVAGPWDECSTEELAAGCYKELYPMSSFVQSFKIAGDEKVDIQVQDRGCEGQMKLVDSNYNEQPMNEYTTVTNSGRYSIVNNTPTTCHVKILQQQQ
jgi:hypothetical protein